MTAYSDAERVDWLIGYDGARLKSHNCGLYGPFFIPGWFVMWTMDDDIDWG
jgi:hypothetical protein